MLKGVEVCGLLAARQNALAVKHQLTTRTAQSTQQCKGPGSVLVVKRCYV